jgi:transporter family-2 protein
MSSIWLYPFILLAGVLQAAGNSMNGQLNKSMSNPWLAATISFGLIVFLFAALFAVIPRPLPTAADVTEMPWWAPLGGLTGAVAVFAGLLFVNKIGAGPFNGLLITANILFSLAIDHFGLLHMPVHAINVWRVLGGVLMVGGIALIALF